MSSSPTAETPSAVIDGRSRFVDRAYTARHAPPRYSVHIPESVVAPYRAQWAKREPTGFDPMTASAHDVAVHACSLPYLLRSSIAAAGRGPHRALKWAQEWLQAGCPGVALPYPRAGWRAAHMTAGGVALYDSDADRCFLWLDPPPWHQPPDAFEEIWHAAALAALEGA